jgi:hypothetical protein
MYYPVFRYLSVYYVLSNVLLYMSNRSLELVFVRGKQNSDLVWHSLLRVFWTLIFFLNFKIIVFLN